MGHRAVSGRPIHTCPRRPRAGCDPRVVFPDSSTPSRVISRIFIRTDLTSVLASHFVREDAFGRELCARHAQSLLLFGHHSWARRSQALLHLKGELSCNSRARAPAPLECRLSLGMIACHPGQAAGTLLCAYTTGSGLMNSTHTKPMTKTNSIVTAGQAFSASASAPYRLIAVVIARATKAPIIRARRACVLVALRANHKAATKPSIKAP